MLHNRIPKLIQSNLEKWVTNVYVDNVKAKDNTFCDKILQNFKYWKYLRYSKNVEYDNVYGNDEFYLSMKYRNQGMKIIEDGPYFNDEKILRKRRTKLYVGLLNYWFYWSYKDYVPWGFDKHVTTYYHTEVNKLPAEIAHKGVLIDIHQLWKAKSEEEKKRIMHVFGINPIVVDTLRKYKTILVTQILPLSNAEKIEMYKSMLSENGVRESELLIKTHYAETIDYRQVFPDACVIDTPVPAQLLDVLGYEADMAMTICSSAIFSFAKKKTKIIFKGTEFDEHLKNFYGVIRLEDFKLYE